MYFKVCVLILLAVPNITPQLCKMQRSFVEMIKIANNQRRFWRDPQYIYKTIYKYDILCENFTPPIQYPWNVNNPFSDYANEPISSMRFINSTIPTIPAGTLVVFSTNILILYLNDCKIEQIGSGAFKNMHGMYELHLENNEIGVLSAKAFAGLKLQTLFLFNNKIKTLNADIFQDMISLQKLNLSTNLISSLNSGTFSSISDLYELDLSNNSITALNPQLFENNSQLTTLYLNNNNISQMPESLDLASTIQVLDISNNFLSEINFEKLKGTVYLQHNQINKLGNFGPQIIHLHMSHNSLTYLPPNVFKTAKKLSTITVDSNALSDINLNALVGLANVSYLNLSHNNLQNLQVGIFSEMASLETLDLSFNHIEHLHVGLFTGLGMLMQLDISHNKIQELSTSTLFPLKRLQTLSLSANLLFNLSTNDILIHFRTLKYINMNNNPWDCEWLMKTVHLFESATFQMARSTSYNVTNIHGITCVSKNRISQKNLTANVDNTVTTYEYLSTTQITENTEETTSFSDQPKTDAIPTLHTSFTTSSHASPETENPDTSTTDFETTKITHFADPTSTFRPTTENYTSENHADRCITKISEVAEIKEERENINFAEFRAWMVTISFLLFILVALKLVKIFNSIPRNRSVRQTHSDLTSCTLELLSTKDNDNCLLN